MRIKYSFPISGDLKPDNLFAFRVDRKKFEFTLEDGFITHLVITEALSISHGPSITRDTSQITHIDLGAANPKKFNDQLKLAEGLLSVYGHVKIDTVNVHIEWLPDSDDEREQLNLLQFSVSKERRREHRPISYDLVARPFIAAFTRDGHEIALSFFNRGMENLQTEQYIEAYYDFYFVLESLFSNGKTKNAAVEKLFLESDSLVNAVNEVASNENNAKCEKFSEEQVGEYVERYVNKRCRADH